MKSTSLHLDEFFASGSEESISPFLIPAPELGQEPRLKKRLLSALLLLAAFIAGFYHEAISSDSARRRLLSLRHPALIDALDDLKNLEINIDVLMTLAALLSVVIGSGMEGGLLLVLFEISAAMETTVGQKTKKRPDFAPPAGAPHWPCHGERGVLLESSVKDIAMGTHLLVRAGEVVPLDGTVIDGSSFVNLVHLTGESAPVAKTIGDPVPAGARNLDGPSPSALPAPMPILPSPGSSNSSPRPKRPKPALEKFLDQFGKKYALADHACSSFCLPAPFPSCSRCPILALKDRSTARLPSSSPPLPAPSSSPRPPPI